MLHKMALEQTETLHKANLQREVLKATNDSSGEGIVICYEAKEILNYTLKSSLVHIYGKDNDLTKGRVGLPLHCLKYFSSLSELVSTS